MGKCENLINSIYCVTQEACSTTVSLENIASTSKDAKLRKLIEILENLHAGSLEAFRKISTNLSEDYRRKCLMELFSRGSAIEENYEAFRKSTALPCNHKVLLKLESEIKVLSILLLRLEEPSANK